MKKLTVSRFSPLDYASQEAFNTLCTNITFTGKDTKKIMMTSTHAHEGKTFTSMNILFTMAKHGKTVVLVDADLRLSSMTATFGLMSPDSPTLFGLAHFLADMVDEGDIVYETNVKGAYMVPVGRTVSNAMLLLDSPKFSQLLTYLSEQFDYVLVDTPPLGAVIDAAMIATSCDGILYVVKHDDVYRQELLDIKRQLEQTGCPVIGAVLNRAATDGYFGRKYYKGYYHTDGGGKAKKKKFECRIKEFSRKAMTKNRFFQFEGRRKGC